MSLRNAWEICRSQIGPCRTAAISGDIASGSLEVRGIFPSVRDACLASARESVAVGRLRTVDGCRDCTNSSSTRIQAIRASDMAVKFLLGLVSERCGPIGGLHLEPVVDVRSIKGTVPCISHGPGLGSITRDQRGRPSSSPHHGTTNPSKGDGSGFRIAFSENVSTLAPWTPCLTDLIRCCVDCVPCSKCRSFTPRLSAAFPVKGVRCSCLSDLAHGRPLRLCDVSFSHGSREPCICVEQKAAILAAPDSDRQSKESFHSYWRVFDSSSSAADACIVASAANSWETTFLLGARLEARPHAPKAMGSELLHTADEMPLSFFWKHSLASTVSLRCYDPKRFSSRFVRSPRMGAIICALAWTLHVRAAVSPIPIFVHCSLIVCCPKREVRRSLLHLEASLRSRSAEAFVVILSVRSLMLRSALQSGGLVALRPGSNAEVVLECVVDWEYEQLQSQKVPFSSTNDARFELVAARCTVRRLLLMSLSRGFS